MDKRIFQLLLAVLAAMLVTAGAAAAAEEEGILEGQDYYQGIYDDNYADDWFYDSYGFNDYEVGEDESWGYFGDEDTDWWGDNEYYSGYYDDNDLNNDWWFDTYDDPGDEGFWDI